MKLLSLLSLVFGAAAMMTPATDAIAAPTGSVEASGDSTQIQTTGNVTFDVDSDAIFDLHGTGTLFVSQRANHTTRTLQAQGSSVIYTVNGVTKPYDEAAKDWLREVLDSAPTPPPPPPAP
jgi:hypothetical protein